MFEKFRVQNTCLIVDLVNGEAVQTKRGLYLANRYRPEIDEIKILSGSICVSRGGNNYEHAVVNESSQVISPVPPPEEVVEVDQIPFLPSPLLRPSILVILDDDSITPSPVAVLKRKERKGRKGKKVFKKE
jgi:hypothetical protein